MPVRAPRIQTSTLRGGGRPLSRLLFGPGGNSEATWVGVPDSSLGETWNFVAGRQAVQVRLKDGHVLMEMEEMVTFFAEPWFKSGSDRGNQALFLSLRGPSSTFADRTTCLGFPDDLQDWCRLFSEYGCKRVKHPFYGTCNL